MQENGRVVLSGYESEFVQEFIEVWKRPTPERLVQCLHADVVLYQSDWEPIHGVEAAYCEFSRLLSWLPDLRGEVDRYCGSDGILFIEWRMLVPLSSEPLTIHAVDRFLLHGKLAIERRVFLDEQPLMKAIMKHPTHWASYIKYRSARKNCAEELQPEPIA